MTEGVGSSSRKQRMQRHQVERRNCTTIILGVTLQMMIIRLFPHSSQQLVVMSFLFLVSFPEYILVTFQLKKKESFLLYSSFLRSLGRRDNFKFHSYKKSRRSCCTLVFCALQAGEMIISYVGAILLFFVRFPLPVPYGTQEYYT